MARTMVSMSSFGESPVSRRKREASPSVETSSICAKICAASGLVRRSFQRSTATDAARSETRPSGSSVRRTASALAAPATARTAPRRRREERRRERMSEVLSGRTAGGEGEGRGGEGRRGAVDGEGIEVRELVRSVLPRDERDRRLAELGGLRKDPVQTLDDPGRGLRRDGGGDPVVRGED